MQISDISGKRFGRLIALQIIEKRKTKTGSRVFWECLCNCGNMCKVEGTKLRSGHTQSCGCLWREAWEIAYKTSADRRRTGFPDLREYHIYLGMIQRCYNRNDVGYKNYGGRGIYICERWRYSFENFYHDVGPRPSPQHSVDRYPDNDGPYSPENTRWATNSEQSKNRRSTRWITYEGQTHCVEEWALILGMKHPTLLGRLDRWDDITRAFTQPIRPCHRNRNTPSST